MAREIMVARATQCAWNELHECLGVGETLTTVIFGHWQATSREPVPTPPLGTPVPAQEARQYMTTWSTKGYHCDVFPFYAWSDKAVYFLGCSVYSDDMWIQRVPRHPEALAGAEPELVWDTDFEPVKDED